MTKTPGTCQFVELHISFILFPFSPNLFNLTYLSEAICSPLELGPRICLVDMVGNGTTVIVKNQRSAYLSVSVRARGKERRR